jgi:Nuclear transport factor 2 (NTF2) domain.
MSTLDIDAIEQACIRLIHRFALYNDMGEYEKLVELFAEDGAFARPTAPDDYIVGRAEILESFVSRPGGKVTRHLVTNTVVEVQDADHATAISYVTQFSANPDTPAKFGFKANPVRLVGEYYDSFVRTAEGWKFAKRSGRVSITVE